MSIADNVAKIRMRMADACARAGRSDTVLLVAATKTRSADEVRQVIAAGVDACGENRIQEMTEKLSLNAYVDAPLHFIGTLQKNKVKYAVGAVSLIESVNSVELMREIDRLAAKRQAVQDVLLEINIAGESSKSGADRDQLEQMLLYAARTPGLRVRGLMAIPPLAQSPGETRPFFREMYKLFVDTASKKYDNVAMDILSMGMSGDFEDAIMEGATAVRIGTALFGQRIYK